MNHFIKAADVCVQKENLSVFILKKVRISQTRLVRAEHPEIFTINLRRQNDIYKLFLEVLATWKLKRCPQSHED